MVAQDKGDGADDAGDMMEGSTEEELKETIDENVASIAKLADFILTTRRVSPAPLYVKPARRVGRRGGRRGGARGRWGMRTEAGARARGAQQE